MHILRTLLFESYELCFSKVANYYVKKCENFAEMEH
jgi:hypothetical protein